MNGKRWQRTILLTIMAASLALSSAALPPAGAALAQSSLTVAVTPTFVDVIRGGTASYHLWVTGGENVNAIDLTITYDPALISEVSYTYGDYLDNIWRVYYVNEPGYFQISLVQLATPGVWGDGDLLNLNFITRANGITLVMPAGARTFAQREGLPPLPFYSVLDDLSLWARDFWGSLPRKR